MVTTGACEKCRIIVYCRKGVIAMRDQYHYINEFNRQNYDKISIMLPKGKREYIKQFAAKNGESVNNLVNRLLQTEANMTDQEWKERVV